ncbi:MAG: hypothetical protein OHK93_008798 [Ramalina farinacea]|uniref:Cytochrome P450 n=1 Tax=Ramalina farinacea TaxID=258253 RepID=A0AA43QPU9_9LECA|nr:hypothetical protein [Ramalina farinacea]
MAEIDQGEDSSSLHINACKLHEKYGDIVRYGPNRISVNTTSGLQGIYGAKANVEKSDFYSTFSNFFGVPASVTIIDRAHHAIRRRITNQAFAMSAVRGMEGVMLDNIGDFCQELVNSNEAVAIGKDVRGWSPARDVSEWISRLAFDIFGDLCFGSNWNTLKSPENRPYLEMISKGTAGLLLVGYMPALLALKVDRIFFRKLTSNTRKFEDMGRQQTEKRIALSHQDGVKRDDIFEGLLAARDPETKQSMSALDLNAEAISLIIAGSETMATVMTATLFYLVHHPSTLAQLRKEIDETFQSVDEIRLGPQLSSCKCLKACIDESMRLTPPIPGLLPRKVIHGGLLIDGHLLPEGTEVGTSLYALHRRESYFRNAAAFEPQRWLMEREQTPLAYQAYTPFSLGPRGCPGKALAYAEMTLTLAKMVFLLDMQLESEVADPDPAAPVEFETRDCFVVAHDGPNLVFKDRVKRSQVQ